MIDVELFLLDRYLKRLDKWVHNGIGPRVKIGSPSVLVESVYLVVIVVLRRCRRYVLLLTLGLCFRLLHLCLHLVLQEFSVLLEHLQTKTIKFNSLTQQLR